MATANSENDDRTPLPLDDRNAARIKNRLKLLSGDNRLRVLLMLTAGPLNVTALCDRTGERQSAISRHLAILRLEGIVSAERQGRRINYSLTDDGWLLLELCRCQLDL